MPTKNFSYFLVPEAPRLFPVNLAPDEFSHDHGNSSRILS